MATLDLSKYGIKDVKAEKKRANLLIIKEESIA